MGRAAQEECAVRAGVRLYFYMAARERTCVARSSLWAPPSSTRNPGVSFSVRYRPDGSFCNMRCRDKLKSGISLNQSFCEGVPIRQEPPPARAYISLRNGRSRAFSTV